MSFSVTGWAMSDAPTLDVQEWAVLVSLAERANDDGTDTFPSIATLAERLRMGERTVHAKLAALTERGVIGVAADQMPPGMERIPANRRPVVYDLLIPLSWFPNLDRIQRERARRGLPPLTADERPDLAPPEKREPARRHRQGEPCPEGQGCKRCTPAGDAGVHLLPARGAGDADKPVPETSSLRSEVSNRSVAHARETPDPSLRSGSAPRRERRAAASDRGTRLPEDWEPDDALMAELREKYPEVDDQWWSERVAAFLDFWCSKPGKDARKLDWRRTFRNWIREDVRRAAPHRSPAPGGNVRPLHPNGMVMSPADQRVAQGLALSAMYAAQEAPQTPHAAAAAAIERGNLFG